MLSLAPDFWALFWVILAAGVAVTVTLSLVIATVPPPWTGWHRPHTPASPHPAPKARARAQALPSGRRPASA